MRRIPLLAPSGDGRREFREWVQAGSFGLMVSWFFFALLWTLGYSPLGVSAQSLDCYSAVLCRMASLNGGHTVVWLIVWGFGLLVGVRTRNFGFGLCQAFFWGCLHEIAWNLVATPALGESYFAELTFSIMAFLVFCVLTVGALIHNRMFRQSLDYWRFLVVVPLWVIFMLGWWSIGFPVTLYGGHTAWFLNPQVNFIEICSYVVWFSAAIGVVKFPSRLSSSPTSVVGEMASGAVGGLDH